VSGLGHLPAAPVAAPTGGPEELREYVVGYLRLAAMYADHGADLATAGDLIGLQTNTAKLIAAVRAAAATVKDIRGM
jgi:hypothetical protein